MIMLLLIFSCLSANALSIYGRDNRSEAALHPDKSAAVEASAGLIREKYLVHTSKGIELKAPSAKSEHLLCDGEAYEHQTSAAHCSGTLIAPDLIYTAGHCYRSDNVCKDSVWVFDYIHDRRIEEKNVYRCQEVFRTSEDFAVIKLDRTVEDRLPVRLAAEDLENRDEVFMVGTMLGVPLKVSDEAQVLGRDALGRYITNLDAYVGNSGSGVYNHYTSELSGILISGETDFVFQQGCYRSRVTPEKLGLEIVLGISSLRRWLESYSTEQLSDPGPRAQLSRPAGPSLSTHQSGK